MLRSEHVRLAGLPWGKSALHRRQAGLQGAALGGKPDWPVARRRRVQQTPRGLISALCLFPFPALERKAFLILPRPSSHPLLASTCPVQPSRPVFFLASFPSLLSHFLPNYSNLICLPTLLMGFVFFIVLCVKSKLVFFFFQ